ncbi:deoxyribonuclease-1-like [Narcine bancroftii]|uniref:deoxyribonuclease-1-like n=1 Tax=Narcine bancroftii TaxID=1343680 RepID=UPI0038321CE8
MVNFYNRFILGPARIMRPLFAMISAKSKILAWTEEVNAEFTASKNALDNATLLVHPRSNILTELTVDASATAIGGILVHSVEGQWRPLAFFSHHLHPLKFKYSVFDRNLLALYLAIRHFRYFLEGRLFTDNKPLTHAFAMAKDPCQGLKIAAFNIQRFGQSKVDNHVTLDILIQKHIEQALNLVLSQILQRYDLITVEEVMDADNSAVTDLVKELNLSTKLKYNYIISDYLGRSSYREKYAFLYREDILKPQEWYHYDDGCEQCGTDTFMREPFIVHFHSLTTIVKDFVLAAIHTSPSYAVREVNALYDVWNDARKHFNTENILILGDYNAACHYVTESDWPKIRLRQYKKFHWLIADEVDTTVSINTHCAYDRFVVSTEGLLDTVVPGSVKAFNFQKAFDLPYQTVKGVSDHYPIELELKDDPKLPDTYYKPERYIGISGGISGGPCSCEGVDMSSCAGRCGAYSHSFPCSCTTSCSKHDDCCHDYKDHC